MADTSRDIELRLRINDLSNAGLKEVTANVDRMTAALDRQIQAATKLEIKERELKDTLKQYDDAAKNVAGLDAILQRYKVIAEQIELQKQRYAEARTALEAHRAAMESGAASGKKAQDALVGFERQVASIQKGIDANTVSLERHGTALREAGADTSNLILVERQLHDIATQIGVDRNKLNEILINYARIQREATQAKEAEAQASRDAAAQAKAEAEARQQANDAIRAQLNESLTAFHARVDANKQAAEAQKKQIEEDAKNQEQWRQRLIQYNQERVRDQISANLKEFNVQQQRNADFKRARDLDLADQKRADTEQTREIRKFVDDFRNLKKLEAEQSGVINRLRSAFTRKPADTATPKPDDPAKNSREAQRNAIGLLPYQSQNLLYQAFDVTQGFAGGQPAFQIFTQQGFQILQLWTKNFADLFKLLPALTPVLAGVAVAVSAVTQAFREANAVRTYGGLIASIADGAGYTSTALVALQHDIRGLGLTWKESGDSIRVAIDNGLNQDKIKAFAEAARNLHDIRPDVSYDEAFKGLVEGFANGIEGIRKLNQAYHLFEPDQLRQIQRLYDEKRNREALNLALDISFKKLAEGEKLAVSPLTEATRKLTRTWDEFILSLSKSSTLQNVVNYLSSAVVAMDNMLKTVEASVELLGAIDKKYPWLKYVVGGPLAAGQGIKGLAELAAGPGKEPVATAEIPGRGTSPSVVDRKDGLTVSAAPEQANVVVDTILKHSGEKLKAMCAALVNEALKAAGLPTSPNNLASSFKNYGSPVRPEDVRKGDIFYTNVGTEGYTGHVGVVTGPISNGRVPVVSSHIQGPASNPAGAETRDASNLIFRRPQYQGDDVFKATASQKADAERTVELAERARTIQKDANAEAARNAFVLEEERKAKEAIHGIDTDPAVIQARAKLVQLALQQYDNEKYKERTAFEVQLRDLRISDGKHADEIARKGQENLEIERQRAAQEGRFLTLAAEHEAILQGQSEARKKFQQEDTFRESKRNIENQLAAVNRQNELKDTTSLENRLKGVDDQYTTIRNNAKKLAEQLSNTTIGGKAKDLLAEITPKIDTAERQAKSLETAKFYNERLVSLTSQRTESINALNAAYDAGAITFSEKEEGIKKIFDQMAPSIEKAASEFKTFLDTNKDLDPTKLDLYNAKLKEFKANAIYISPLMKDVKAAIENSFTTGLSNAFNTVAESVGNLIAKTGSFKDVLTAVKTAAASFFAGLLKDIAAAILKYEALKLVSSFGLGGSGGVGGLLTSILGGSSATGAVGAVGDAASKGAVAAVLHGGGVVGRAGRTTLTPESWWAGAPRYHSGTVVGLSPGEQRAILARGEEVLSADNPRNILNGGGGIGDINIRSVLVDDPSRVHEALASAQGERTIIQTLARNIPTVRSLLRG